MNNPYEKPQRKCILCEHGIVPNYKNVKLLSQFVSPFTGQKYEKHITGLCQEKQKELELAISTAETLGNLSV